MASEAETQADRPDCPGRPGHVGALVCQPATRTGEPEQLRFYIFLGLVAYSWWLLAIALSVRPPWLDRLVGLPSIYGLHGMLGFLAIYAAYEHSENSYSPSQLARDL